jgi:hypothetical protein
MQPAGDHEGIAAADKSEREGVNCFGGVGNRTLYF